MLRARLGGDDNEEEEEDDEDGDETKPVVKAEPLVADDDMDFVVRPKQANEWTCAVCFLIVDRSSANADYCPHCGADAAVARPAPAKGKGKGKGK